MGANQNFVYDSQNPNSKKSNKKQKRSRHTVSWVWPLFFLAAGCVLFYLIHLLDHLLPTVISPDEAAANPGVFSGERSRNSLRKLTNLGPRVVGDIANEVYAPKIIEDEVLEAQSNAHSSQSILVERQKGSGAYFLGFSPGFTNIYNDVQNVLVKVEGSEGKHSILVNCHYDTVPSSDGAADDALTCAIMLELIRALSIQTKRLKHNVVFLFNGAEETPLEASHLFLSHPWAESCRVVLNLEAAGQAGRAMLFQSGPENSWLFNYYVKYSPHLHGQVWIEELFQSGFIPSDTDFRIFRDFGKMPGLDFAFGRNGYVYHTRYDTEAYIPTGSHQHLGDNIMALLNSLGYAEEFYDMKAHAEGEMVYYDYIGWFMIAYSYGGGIAINVIGILLAIFSMVLFVGRVLDWGWLPKSTGIFGRVYRKITCQQCSDEEDDDTFSNSDVTRDVKYEQQRPQDDENSLDSIENIKRNLKNAATRRKSIHHLDEPKKIVLELTIAIVARLLAILAAVGMTAAFGAIINSAADLVMPWYSNIWLIFPLYWCPALVMYALVPYLVDMWRHKKRGLSKSTVAQMNLIAAQVPWVIAILVLTCMGVRSSSVFVFPVYSSAIANIVIHLTPLYKTVNKWIWVYLFIHIPSCVFTMYITLLVYVMLVPICARSGVINSDLYMAVVTSLATLYVISFIIPLMTLVRKQPVVYVFLTLFSVIMIIISLTTPVGFPYRKGPNNPTPQRYWIMHSDREFYNSSQMLRKRETGYFVLNLDPNSPRTIPLKTRDIRSLKPDCDDELYCGLPFYMTRMIPLSGGSSWIPGPAPNLPHPVELMVNQRCGNEVGNICTMNLQLKGPDRMTLTFSPRDGAELINWSVPTSIKKTGEWKDRSFYYLHITRADLTKGDYFLQLQFNVTMQQKSGSPFLDIALAGNHAHHDKYRTVEFQNFLNDMPDWTMIFGWISAIKLFVF